MEGSKKHLVIIGYSGMNNWNKINKYFFNNSSGKGIVKVWENSQNGYNLYFLQAKGELKKDDILSYFKEQNIEEKDEIIVFSHKYFKEEGGEHPGTTEEHLKEVKKCYQKLEYEFFGSFDVNHLPVDFLRTIDEVLPNNKSEKLTEELKNELTKNFPWETLKEEVKKKVLIDLLPRIKHWIAHIFLPLDIDLQGLKESNFNEQYFEDVIEAWKGKTGDKIEEARKLIYKREKDSSQKEKCLEEIIEEKRLENNPAWENLKQLLPENGNSDNEEYQTVKKILDCLNNSQNEGKIKKEAIKEYLKDNNPFHKWFCDLCDALDGLREQE